VAKDGAAEFWWIVYDTRQIEIARPLLLEREKTVERGMPRVESGEKRRRRKEIYIFSFLGVVGFCTGSYRSWG
jgi:hypothetical protein